MAVAKDTKTPGIARATAQADLGPYLSEAVLPALEAGLAEPDAMLRSAALDALLAAPPQERLRLGLGLIDDPSPIVRIKAARVLAIIPEQGGDAAMRTQLQKVFAEYVASQQANADRPEARLNLGLFYVERHDPLKAEAEYRAALALDADFVPAYVNLADLYRLYQREADAQTLLTDGLRQVPGNADLQHALGLLCVRQGRIADALPLLEGAARADPNNARYAYVYAVALNSTGASGQAMTVLDEAHRQHPADRACRRPRVPARDRSPRVLARRGCPASSPANR
jgi:tetratricopeptide (TPR) repeat protein